MIKVAFMDIDTDEFKIVIVDSLQDIIPLFEGADEEDSREPLDFDYIITINEDVDNGDLLELLEKLTFKLEEECAIIASDSFGGEDLKMMNNVNKTPISFDEASKAVNGR